MSQRELLAYAQIAALLLLLVGGAIILIQVFFLQPEWIDLGTIPEVRGEPPILRVVSRRDMSILHVWVVYARNEWFVFDGLTPFDTECYYAWQVVTGRFEDPCAGAKFSLSGEFVDPYGGFAGKSVQNLNQYPVSLRDGHVFVDANRVIHAQPFIAPGLAALYREQR